MKIPHILSPTCYLPSSKDPTFLIRSTLNYWVGQNTHSAFFCNNFTVELTDRQCGTNILANPRYNLQTLFSVVINTIHFCPEDSLSLCNHTTSCSCNLRFHIMACLWNISLSEFTTWSVNHYTAFHINHSSIDAYLIFVYFLHDVAINSLTRYLMAHVV